VYVADSGSSQLCRQDLAVELRIVSRSGDTAYVYDALDAVRPQKIEEVFPCMGRMPNGQDSRHFGLDFPHDEFPFPTNSCQEIKADHPTIKTPLENSGLLATSTSGLHSILKGNIVTSLNQSRMDRMIDRATTR
jgi:hypothetical protein